MLVGPSSASDAQVLAGPTVCRMGDTGFDGVLSELCGRDLVAGELFFEPLNGVGNGRRCRGGLGNQVVGD